MKATDFWYMYRFLLFRIKQVIASFQSMDRENIGQHMDVIFCPYNLILDHDNHRTKLDHVTNPNTK